MTITLSDFQKPAVGWGSEPHGARKKRHYVRDGRHQCNGTGAKSEINDTRLNLPGGCIACKIALGLCSPWHRGYADPARRGLSC